MKSSKKNRLFDSYLLKGKLRRSGYEKIRYIFSGVNRLTGEKKSFFVELYYVNPLVSPDTPVLAQKFRPVVSPACAAPLQRYTLFIRSVPASASAHSSCLYTNIPHDPSSSAP